MINIEKVAKIFKLSIIELDEETRINNEYV